MARPERIHDRIVALCSELGGTVGVAARNLASQASVCVNADELLPVASCFKIPVMVEVMRRVDAVMLRLDDRLTLTEAEKTPAGMPTGVFVANKTGGVSGAGNDAAIVSMPSGAPLVVVVYLKGLSYRARERASHAIAGIAAKLYERLGEPA